MTLFKLVKQKIMLTLWQFLTVSQRKFWMCILVAPGERSNLLSKTCDRHMWRLFLCTYMQIYYGGTLFGKKEKGK